MFVGVGTVQDCLNHCFAGGISIVLPRCSLAVLHPPFQNMSVSRQARWVSLGSSPARFHQSGWIYWLYISTRLPLHLPFAKTTHIQNTMDRNPRPPNRRRRAPPLPDGFPRGLVDIIDFASVAIPLGAAPASPPPNEGSDDDDPPPTRQPDALDLLGGVLAAAMGPGGPGGPGRGVGAVQHTVPSDEVAAREDRMAMEEENRALLKDADRLRK